LAVPTAQQSEAELQATASNLFDMVVVVLGELTVDHELPFQRWIIVWSVPSSLMKLPTAQQLVTLVQATPYRKFCWPGSESGELTTAHVVPFHLRMRVWKTLPLSKYPTAEHSELDAHATLFSVLVFNVDVLGEAAIAQAVPFHRSTKVCWTPPPASYDPTAQQFVLAVQVTPLNRFGSVGSVFAEVEIDQADPFQCSINVCSALPATPWNPTTQQSVDEAQVTPLRKFCWVVLLLGDATITHAPAVQCKTRVCWSGLAVVVV
jgi:hypothetical protein